MKTLKQCKDEIARKEGHNDWLTCEFRETLTSMEFIMEQVAELYASQYKEELSRLKGGWISVSNDLPPMKTRVIGLLEEGRRTIVKRMPDSNKLGYRFWDDDEKEPGFFISGSVIAWQPLPAPPEAVSALSINSENKK